VDEGGGGGGGGVIRARATIQIMGSTGMLVMVSTRKGAGRRSAHHEHGGSGQWRPRSHPIPSHPSSAGRRFRQTLARSPWPERGPLRGRTLHLVGVHLSGRRASHHRRQIPSCGWCECDRAPSGAEPSRGPEQSRAQHSSPFFRVPAALRPTPTRSSSSSSSCTLNEGRRLEGGSAGRAAAAALRFCERHTRRTHAVLYCRASCRLLEPGPHHDPNLR
jgi:hypothetical protein